MTTVPDGRLSDMVNLSRAKDAARRFATTEDRRQRGAQSASEAPPVRQNDGALMSQRESGYERKERDAYQTPAWVTLALVPHLRALGLVWEPASGDGAMVDALTNAGLEVTFSDIDHGCDFLEMGKMIGCDAIIINPPYALAQEFIEHALDMMEPHGLVAMLLRTDYDHAKTRAHLFHGCPAFAKKVVLTRRIVWFEDGEKSPSFNHAWFIWDWHHSGPPTIAYDIR
jgi:hypothetical protein